jgi:hypothetical protein
MLETTQYIDFIEKSMMPNLFEPLKIRAAHAKIPVAPGYQVQFL